MASLDVKPETTAKNEADTSKRKPFRDWHGASIGLIIGISGVVAGRMGYLWIGFDVVSQFGMQFLLLTVSALIAMATPRYKGLIASTLFVLMLSGYSLWPHLVSATPFKPDPLAPGEQQLQVASFNTYGLNNDHAEIAAAVLAINADVVTMIEMGTGKADVLSALKSVYPYQGDCQNYINCELAIVSKYPLSSVIGDANWEGPSYIRATVELSSGPLTVFGIHTTRFPHSRAQLKQVNALVKLVEGISGPVIIMGDFNATPFSRINHTVSEGLNFTRVTSLPTWPATIGFPQLAIDHIFVSPGIRAISSQQIGNNAGSDHYPISIVLAVSNK